MFSVVVPNYNGLRFLKKNLNSILLSLRYTSEESETATIRGEASLEIIVVDNGSTDNSVEFVRKFNVQNSMFKIILIENKDNFGFARAVNQGIKRAKNDWVVVMNNDVRVEKNWFEEIYESIKNPPSHKASEGRVKFGCLFGKVMDWKGERIESVGLDFEVRGKSKNIGNGEVDNNRYNQSKLIWGAPASIVAYKKSALEEVGYFDEDFFAYLEDVDLAIRLNAKGWKTLYVPEAVSYHYGGGTADRITGFRKKYTARNWWYIIVKHYPGRVFFGHLPKILFEQAKNFFAVNGFKNKFWVIKEFVVNFKKIWRKRKPKELGAS